MLRPATIFSSSAGVSTSSDTLFHGFLTALSAAAANPFPTRVTECFSSADEGRVGVVSRKKRWPVKF
jgi:hypothetical protein